MRARLARYYQRLMSSRPRILAVDCATIPASVAVLSGTLETQKLVQDNDLRSDAWLGTAIGKCLTESNVGIGDLDGLAASVGPGTFTGIRVGIATCLGLAAPLGLPVVGVRTLDALATIARSESDVIAACIDARRGQIYGALYGPEPSKFSLPLEPIWGPNVCDPEEFARLISAKEPRALICGSGTPMVASHGTFHVAGDRFPLATAIGSLAARTWKPCGNQSQWPSPRPVYLRPADARPPRNPLRDQHS